MRPSILAAASFGFALAISSAAQAQQAQPQQQSQQQSQAQPGQQQPPARSEQKQERQTNTQSLTSIPAEADKIVGKSVLGQNGEQVGKVSDVLIDKDGKVSGLVMTRGGAMGIAARRSSCPGPRLRCMATS